MCTLRSRVLCRNNAERGDEFGNKPQRDTVRLAFSEEPFGDGATSLNANLTVSSILLLPERKRQENRLRKHLRRVPIATEAIFLMRISFTVCNRRNNAILPNLAPVVNEPPNPQLLVLLLQKFISVYSYVRLHNFPT